MKQLKKYINESLLGDDILSQVDKMLVKEWVEKNVKYNKVIYLKNGTIKFSGDVLIKEFDGDSFPSDFIISAVSGDFKIEKCPNLKNINGLFQEYTDVEGDYVVSNCKNIESIAGGPWCVKGNLSFINNPSLKSLDGMPSFVYDNIYLMKNGKKFKQKDVEQYVSIITRVVCSMEEDHEEQVNEAMNEPHLLELAKQLKDNPISSDKFSNFNQIFGRAYVNPNSKYRLNSREVTIPLDEIDSSNVKEYNKVDDNAKKAIRKIVSDKRGKGLILLKNYKNEYIGAITHYKRYISLISKDHWRDVTYSEIMMIVDGADSVVVISWDDNTETKVYHKIIKRMESRKGMIKNTPEDNEQIAISNRNRYKALASKMKLKKDEEAANIDGEVQDIVMKALQSSKIAKTQPHKYDVRDITKLNNLSRELLNTYASYTTYYLNINKNNDFNKSDAYMCGMYKDQLLDKIEACKDFIKDHNM